MANSDKEEFYPAELKGSKIEFREDGKLDEGLLVDALKNDCQLQITLRGNGTPPPVPLEEIFAVLRQAGNITFALGATCVGRPKGTPSPSPSTLGQTEAKS